jgi:Fe-S oxidoreductase
VAKERRLEDFKYDAERCIGCGGCRWVDHIYMSGVKYGQKCPSIQRYLFLDHQAAGRLKIANALLEGRLRYSPYLLKTIYQCNLCGACDVGCKRNLDLEVLSVLELLRARAVEDGKGPMPEHKALCKNITSKKNRYGASQKARFKWVDKDWFNEKDRSSPAYLYFVGCASSFFDRSLAKSTAGLLHKTGATFSLLNKKDSEEWCCGHPLIVTGQIKEAKKIIENNLKAIKETRAQVVLTSCAECYKTIKVDYPKIMGVSTKDLGFKVTHLVEFLDDAIEKKEITFKKKLNMKVTYHDPCNLGRLSEPWIHWEGVRKKYGVLDPPKEFRRGTYGVYDPPRRILNRIPGIELVEMIRHKENTWCCGAGGGVKEAFFDFSMWTASKRLEEMEEAGAEAIITACPYCKEIFQQAAKKTEKQVKVLDIVEVLHLAL